MIVGENSRTEDLDVNAVRDKQLNNMREARSAELVRLAPHRQLSLDQALEFIRSDECVEVTPDAVRLRKLVLAQTARATAAKRAKSARLAAAASG
jgi:GTP-binding protein